MNADYYYRFLLINNQETCFTCIVKILDGYFKTEQEVKNFYGHKYNFKEYCFGVRKIDISRTPESFFLDSDPNKYGKMKSEIPQFAVVSTSKNSWTGESEQKVILESDDQVLCYKKALELQKSTYGLDGPWSLNYSVAEN